LGGGREKYKMTNAALTWQENVFPKSVLQKIGIPYPGN